MVCPCNCTGRTQPHGVCTSHAKEGGVGAWAARPVLVLHGRAAILLLLHLAHVLHKLICDAWATRLRSSRLWRGTRARSARPRTYEVGPGPRVVIVAEVLVGRQQKVQQLQTNTPMRAVLVGLGARSAAGYHPCPPRSHASSTWFQVSLLTARLWWVCKNPHQSPMYRQRVGGTISCHMTTATSSITHFCPFSLRAGSSSACSGAWGGAPA